jgi:hypothetical protein
VVEREGTSELTWKNRNVAEDGLGRLVENVRHLVLEVLRRDERVQQLLPTSGFEGSDLATGTSDVGGKIENFPELVDAWKRATEGWKRRSMIGA